MAANGNVNINVHSDNSELNDLIRKFENMNQPVRSASNAIAGFVQDTKKAGDSMRDTNNNMVLMAQALGQLNTKSQQPRQALRELTNVINESTTAYRSLSDEEKNSPFGQALSQSIDQLTQRAGEMKDVIDDTNQKIKNLASDTGTFDKLSGAATFASASFQTVSAAMGLVGAKNEDVMESMQKLQAVMAITNGLRVIQTNLQKQSALMMGVESVQTAIATAAKTAFAAATGNATLAQTAFNVVAKANPYVLLATTAIAAATAIYAFVKSNKENKEAEEASAKAAEEQKRATEELKNTMIQGARTVTDQIVKYRQLRAEWNSLSSAHQKNQWIKDNQKGFKDLGQSITNAGQAENFFNRQTQAVIRSFTLRAQAAAKAAVAVSLFQKATELSLTKKTVAISQPVTAGQTFEQAGVSRVEAGRAGLGLKLGSEWGRHVITPEEADAISAQRRKDAVKAAQSENANIDNQMNSLIAQGNKLISEQLNLLSQAQDAYHFNGGKSGGGHSGRGGNNKGDNKDDIKKADIKVDKGVSNGIGKWLEKNRKNELKAGEIKYDNGRDQIIAQNRFKYMDATANAENNASWNQSFEKITGHINKAVSGFSDIASGLKGLGIDSEEMEKVVGTIQSLMTIIQGVMSVVEVVQTIIGTSQQTAILANTAALIANTSAITVNSGTNLIPLARGGVVHAANGIVAGSNYVDRVPATLTSGEMVINSAQQSALWKAISSGNYGGGGGSSTISGEQIVTVINAYGRRTRKGEILR